MNIEASKAVFEPDGTVTSPDFMEEPGKERSLTLSLYGKPFLVTAVNQSAQPSAIKNSDITAIYASQPELFAPGGIRPGDPVDDLILSLGEPFQVVNGAEIDSSYGHLNQTLFFRSFSQALGILTNASI